MGIREISVQDTRTESSTKQEQLGARAFTDDGREWVYVKNGAVALAPGKLVVNADEVANHVNQSVAAAAAVGDLRVQVTLGATAATENQYQDGFLTINDAAGEGISYRIAGHGAADASADLWIDLDEPVKVALTTSSEASLHSPHSGVIVSVADQADFALGVPNIAITAAYYGWLQTRGHCAVLADEIIAKGAAVTTGSSVVGAVEAVDAAGEAQIGIAEQATVDTEYRPIFLTLS